jgi:hypothetical protein
MEQSMMNIPRKQYTAADFKVSNIAKFSREGDVIAHTHTVKFSRPPTEVERQLFQSVLASFCLIMRFLPDWGGEFVAEPAVEFIDEQTDLYTFRQKTMSGEWKEVLFAVLANFSADIVPILRHDESAAFDPARMKIRA